MSATKERWMLFGTFVLTVLFVSLFIWPNYKNTNQAKLETENLESRIQQIELRQAEVEKIRMDYEALKAQVHLDCKQVPSIPDMSQIVQALSLEVDGRKVLDQSFTAGTTSKNSATDGFAAQTLAVTLHADFESIFSVIQNVEAMNRLVRVSSVRMIRKESDSDATAPALEAAIGLHAMYDVLEEE